ncbi:MAG: hypothetical protein AAGL90_01540 [Pseudomonadota bacterium]
MNKFPMHDPADPRVERFNGPIIDREHLRHGTYVAMMTAIGSIVLVVAIKALYIIF